MHEMALAEGILGVALDVSEGQAVRQIKLRVGALQHVTRESLQFCFELAAQDTPAAGAVLTLEELPARLRCRACGAEAEARGAPFQCPACGSFDQRVLSGEELLVDAIELESGWLYRPGAEAGESAVVEVSAEHLAEHAAAEAAGRQSSGLV
jgi:hydrogenase nickel incorporation protein HypA/HybF